MNEFPLMSICQQLEKTALSLPDLKLQLATNTAVPYFIVGDDSFPLHTWLMKPFPQRCHLVAVGDMCITRHVMVPLAHVMGMPSDNDHCQ